MLNVNVSSLGWNLRCGVCFVSAVERSQSAVEPGLFLFLSHWEPMMADHVTALRPIGRSLNPLGGGVSDVGSLRDSKAGLSSTLAPLLRRDVRGFARQLYLADTPKNTKKRNNRYVTWICFVRDCFSDRATPTNNCRDMNFTAIFCRFNQFKLRIFKEGFFYMLI